MDAEEVSSLIERLWLADNLPIQDGLYRADGTAYGVEVDASAPGGLKILAPISLEEFLSLDPDMVTSIDITVKKPLPRDAGYVFSGEGSYGSEGFFGRLDQDNNLAWVVYLEYSNPFIEATINGVHVTFTSSSNVSITVDLESPQFQARS